MHRTRLLVQHLPASGWEPIVLTVDEKYYEGQVDLQLKEIIDPSLRIQKVDALPIGPLRLVGDLGLRSFFSLYRNAIAIIKKEHIDLVFISIPSFYISLLGRWIHARTRIPYVIDYIDPWVHEFPDSDRLLSRGWWSTRLAQMLEPIAVRYARVITGVDRAYFQPVLNRNPHLNDKALSDAFPYGWESNDLRLVTSRKISSSDKKTIDLIYAGAILPRSLLLLRFLFTVIAKNKERLCDFRFRFIGTAVPNRKGYVSPVEALAKEMDVWREQVEEIPSRMAYGPLLEEIGNADGVFILGGTEAHYTPSKLYNAVLMKKPVFAMLHEKSTTVELIRSASMGKVFTIGDPSTFDHLENELCADLLLWKNECIPFGKGDDVQVFFKQMSAAAVSHKLANLLNQAL